MGHVLEASEARYRTKALKAGFDRHLAKPPAIKDIERAMEEGPFRTAT